MSWLFQASIRNCLNCVHKSLEWIAFIGHLSINYVGKWGHDGEKSFSRFPAFILNHHHWATSRSRFSCHDRYGASPTGIWKIFDRLRSRINITLNYNFLRCWELLNRFNWALTCREAMWFGIVIERWNCVALARFQGVMVDCLLRKIFPPDTRILRPHRWKTNIWYDLTWLSLILQPPQ